MNELEAARLIAKGKLPSPFVHGNITLFAVRVTGTGMAYRDSLDELVWRDPSIYLNDDFLARVSGLPLIWEHPKKGSLNSKEFGDRVIGSLMFGYIKGDDVWGVARVYDDEAIKLMKSEQLSTSPGVVFKRSDGNQKGEMDGTPFLFEGNPSTLCHLAVCEAGVWDVGGPPTGVQNDLLSTQPNGKDDGSMADEREEIAAADKARHDAAEMKLDAIMDAFKRVDARLDAMEEEKKDKARHDAARKDKFGRRKDGEKYDAWKKRHDEDEASMADALRKDGKEEKDCMDAAKSARMDAEEEEKRSDKDFEKWAKEEEKEPAHKEDKRKDAEPPEDKDELKKAETEEKEEEEPLKDRKDSATMKENAELRLRLARLEGLVKGITNETSTADMNAIASAQSRADSLAAMFGDRAPQPIPGELPLDYRRRLLKRFAPHSERFKNSRFDSLDESVLVAVEDQVYADAAGGAKQTAKAQPGILSPFQERDQSGRMITRFHGDVGAFLQPFMPATATVGRFINPRSKV